MAHSSWPGLARARTALPVLWYTARLALWGCAAFFVARTGFLTGFAPDPPLTATSPAARAMEWLGFYSALWFGTGGAVVNVLLFADSAARLRQGSARRRHRFLLFCSLPPLLGTLAELALLLWMFAARAAA